MYNDYPTIYETAIDQNLIYFIILGIILLIILIITFISLAKVFKKANRSGISAIIPIYNIIMLLEITNTSKWYLLFLLIPGVNLIFLLMLMFSLAENFRKSKLFAVGLTFLPFIFYPILAFGKSEYIGINLVAMEGKSLVADIPRIIEPEEKNLVVHEESDTASKNIGISIGGGVYQKDYTNNLLQVDMNQAILNKNNIPTDNSSSKIPTDKSNTPSFITQIQAEKKIEEPKSISTSFAEQMNSVPETKVEKIEPQLQNQNIFTPNDSTVTTNNGISMNLGPINQSQPLAQPTKVNSNVQLSNQPSEKSEFISCPKCGAKIKSGAKICFLCGKALE